MKLSLQVFLFLFSQFHAVCRAVIVQLRECPAVNKDNTNANVADYSFLRCDAVHFGRKIQLHSSGYCKGRVAVLPVREVTTIRRNLLPSSSA
jgi:hypothetical protein